MSDIKTIPITFEDLISTGLLWKINHDLLHEIGLAFAISDAGDGNVTLSIMVSDDGIWEFPEEINGEKSAIYNKWYDTLEVPQK